VKTKDPGSWEAESSTSLCSQRQHSLTSRYGLVPICYSHRRLHRKPILLTDLLVA
jgi:hypothetical protein